MNPNSAKVIVEETNTCYYAWSMINEGFFSDTAKKRLGRTLKIGSMALESDSGKWFPEVDDWHKLAKFAIDKLDKHELQIEELILDHKKYGERVYKLCNQIEKKKINKASEKQIADWFKKLWKDFIIVNAYGFIPVICDFESFSISSDLIEILKKHKVKEEKVQEYMSILASSILKSQYFKEQKELLELCKKYKSVTKLGKEEEFNKHIKKWIWLNYGYQGPAWHREDFLERADNIFKEKLVAKQYKEHCNSLKDLLAHQNVLFKKLKLNKQEKHLFKAARIFMYCKSYRTEVRHRFHYISDMLFKELCKRKSVPISLFRYATREEILCIIANKKVNEKEIINRRKLMLEVTEKGKKRFIAQNKIEEFLNTVLIKEEEIKGNEIYGHAAYRGKAKGNVKIVHGMNDMYKVKEGDILISPSTTPDVLPAMKLAVAFVTDQGGVTSHAAIVAREMKKPCIVGTRLATKLFKDGDKVEVDANHGVVKKI